MYPVPIYVNVYNTKVKYYKVIQFTKTNFASTHKYRILNRKKPVYAQKNISYCIMCFLLIIVFRKSENHPGERKD
jgi:hypothetical protein